MLIKVSKVAIFASFILLVYSFFLNAQAQSCPASHPYQCGGACYVDANQASSGGCSGGGNTGGGSGSGGSSGGGGNSGGGNGDQCFSSENPSLVESGRRTQFTQSWCDTNCVTYVGNGTGCLNAAGRFVSNASICSDPANAKEAMIDIEYNLGINIDDQFISQSGYQGAPPSLNPGLTLSDARTYFRALLGTQEGDELTNALNTNGDNWIDRNEASQAKGADPRQVLTTGFGCGLSTDDILAYVGLYIGDGAIDKYAGDLDDSVKTSMLRFTRSWQPGVDVRGCEYRGGCGGGSSGGGSSGGGNNGGGSSGGGSSGGSDYSFIINKGDGTKMGTGSTSNNARVNSLSASDNSSNTQWKRNNSDSGYFYLRHRKSDKHVRPYSSNNGASLRLQPNSWQGALQQYRFVSSGDGYGYIRNRQTGKQLRSYGQGRYIQNRPSSWQGALNRWKFESAN